MGYRNIVVGTDGSDTAGLAVRQAAEMAKAFDARLTVVTAYQPDPDKTTAMQEQAPEDVRWAISDSHQAEDRAKTGQKIARELGLKDVKVVVEEGDAAERLIAAAENTTADLIVMGSVGMTSPKRFVLGNVPNKVTHHAPCDVVVVHTAD